MSGATRSESAALVETRRNMNREIILVSLAFPLALGLGLMVGVMSETGEVRTATECADRTRDIAERYNLRATSPGHDQAQRQLLLVCMNDPAAFAHLTRKTSQ